MDSRLDDALLALRKDSRVLRHRRASADCFGANPVASALGSPPGATPASYANIPWGSLIGLLNRNFLLGWNTPHVLPRYLYHLLPVDGCIHIWKTAVAHPGLADGQAGAPIA